jgi:hypothetical protein
VAARVGGGYRAGDASWLTGNCSSTIGGNESLVLGGLFDSQVLMAFVQELGADLRQCNRINASRATLRAAFFV